jgi:hypothetical protein
MNRTDIDAALAAANPLSDRTAATLSLHDAELELIERIASTSVRSRQDVPTRSRGQRRLTVMLAVTAAVAATLALLPSGEREGAPTPAFAAPLVRFANASPLALLELPGWHVVYADEQANGFGEMHFVRGPADDQGNPLGVSPFNQGAVASRVASLTWNPISPRWRARVSAGYKPAPTGLGVTVRDFVFEGGSRRAFSITAIFVYRGRVLAFRASVTSMAMFRRELRALKAVDTTTWLRAMPPSVVRTADSGETIRLMLKGIPLPPGFDASRIRGARLVHERYQLGAAVTGTIACMWIADWNHARATGDIAMVRRATAAMATAPEWPILDEMARDGAWPQVLIGYAQAMRRGATAEGKPSMPLAHDADSGLGCSASWGISLGR